MKRLLRRIVGGDIEPGLGPLLLTLGLGVSGMYMFWSFFALWAIEELGMSKGSVGLAYLGAAVLGMTGGIVGGTVSDRVGRKPVILVAGVGQIVLTGILVIPGIPAPVAVTVLALFALTQPIRGAAQGALVADVVPEERRPHAFGTFRVAFNTGALLGPLIAAGLVTLSWSALHAGVVTLYVLSLLAALRLPSLPPVAAGANERASVIGQFASPVFLSLFVAGLFAATTYNAFETLLPVSLTQEHGYAPAAWGVLFAINPVLVLLLQMRITRWSQPLAPAVRLPIAMLMMGFSFLLLLVASAPVALVTILVVFVVGEMLWAPNADSLIAKAAPVASRGAFMGALGISTWIGGALAPAVGLRIADVGGDSLMWVVVAAVSLCGAVGFIVAERLVSERAPDAAPAAQPSG